MHTNTEIKLISHDPWNDLVRQTAVVAVPLDQVLAGLAVPAARATAVKDELMEQLTRIIAEAKTDETEA